MYNVPISGTSNGDASSRLTTTNLIGRSLCTCSISGSSLHSERINMTKTLLMCCSLACPLIPYQFIFSQRSLFPISSQKSSHTRPRPPHRCRCSISRETSARFRPINFNFKLFFYRDASPLCPFHPDGGRLSLASSPPMGSASTFGEFPRRALPGAGGQAPPRGSS